MIRKDFILQTIALNDSFHLKSLKHSSVVKDID